MLNISVARHRRLGAGLQVLYIPCFLRVNGHLRKIVFRFFLTRQGTLYTLAPT
jgi:hypothetical protein